MSISQSRPSCSSEPESTAATRVNRRTIRVEWGDCDAARIVYFPRYFVWFDDSTSAAFAAVGLTHQRLIDQYGIVGMPIRDAHANFSRPSTYDDELLIETRITAWGNTSFTVRHRLFNRADASTAAVEGTEVRVWAVRDPDRPGGLRGETIPMEVRRRFEIAQDSLSPAGA